MLKLQVVILKAMAKKISWLAAAEIAGVSDRTMRRMQQRLPGVRLYRTVRPATGPAEYPSDSDADGRAGAGIVSGSILRSERATFSREVSRGARAGDQLQLGETGAARSGASSARPEAGQTPAAARAAAAAGHAAAHPWQPASPVSGRSLVPPDRDFRWCDRPDPLPATRGGKIQPHRN